MTCRWEEKMIVYEHESETGRFVTRSGGMWIYMMTAEQNVFGPTVSEKAWSWIRSQKNKSPKWRNGVVSGRWMKAARKPVCSCCSCLLAAAWLPGRKPRKEKKERGGERKRDWEKVEWQCAQLHNSHSFLINWEIALGTAKELKSFNSS